MNKSKKQKAIKTISIIVLSIIIFAALCYTTIYAYWGKRHTVLYTVDKVYVTSDEKKENIYHLKYDVTAKNWIHDFSSKSYTLTPHMGGSLQADYGFSGETTPVTIDGNNETHFYLYAQFDFSDFIFSDETENYDPSTVAAHVPRGIENKEKLKELILLTDFIDSDYEDNYHNYSLYMNDNHGFELIFE